MALCGLKIIIPIKWYISLWVQWTQLGRICETNVVEMGKTEKIFAPT